MPHGPLIDAAALATSLGQPGWVVVDCRFDLAAPAAGRAAYDRGHIPGARYADLDRDLARRPGPADGRHPLPDPVAFAEHLGEWGIDRDSVVVAYDEASGAIAARLWWLLGWLGHDRSLVLDGGFAAWGSAGLPVETVQPSWQPKRFEPRAVKTSAVVSTADVESLPPPALLVDARGAPRYRGEQEPIDPVAGHVPGAVNRPFAASLAAGGIFKPAMQLRAELSELIGERDATDIVAMCGSGVTACHLLLAMRIAGLEDGKLYAGSWSEWIRDPARAVKTGTDP